MAKRTLQMRFVAMASPLALVAGLAMAPQTFAAEKSYWSSSAGEMWRTGYGKCWKGVDGMPGPIVECGDAPADADGDGVPNEKDKCPATPKGIEVDENGCPLDSDGDGVPDAMDRCPGTPAGVSVDASGCPVDSDGDGVADYLDKCPGTPAGMKVDTNGCQIIGNIVIDSVEADFAFDSDALKPAMTTALDKIAAQIQASRGQEVLTIVGHTDSIGSEAYNQGLSERRANSVANYLAKQGLDRNAMVISGAGETQPVADNKVESGRAQNRRVVVHTK